MCIIWTANIFPCLSTIVSSSPRLDAEAWIGPFHFGLVVQAKQCCKCMEGNRNSVIFSKKNNKSDLLRISFLLRRCESLSEGIQIHETIIKIGLGRHIFLCNLLIQMYGTCGDLWKARSLFDSMDRRNLFTWNIMLAIYMGQGQLKEALEVFKAMPERDVVTWNTLIAGYIEHGHIEEGLHVFLHMPERNVVSWNAMVAGFIQNGKLEQALLVFQNAPDRDTYSWNTILKGYTKGGYLKEAFQLFKEMPMTDVVSWTLMIDCCAKLGKIEVAFQLFQQMPYRNAVSWNTIIAAYAQSGKLNQAVQLILQMPQPDVISWTTILAAYCQKGQLDEAYQLFQKMPARNIASWNALLSGYAANGQFKKALELFQRMPNKNVASWNATIFAYTQNGAVKEATELFGQMNERNIVSWNTIIAGHGKHGKFMDALQLFYQMQKDGMKPDEASFISLLDACARNADLTEGKKLHKAIISAGLKSDVAIQIALVNMYAKCGSLEDASSAFSNGEQDLRLWTAMLGAFAQYGLGNEAFEAFEKMGLKGIMPDEVSFSSILSACSNAGLVYKGCYYFISMTENYRLSPRMEQYNCIISLLGRMGWLEEIEALINNMLLLPDSTSWTTLLGLCIAHSEFGKGAYAAGQILKLGGNFTELVKCV